MIESPEAPAATTTQATEGGPEVTTPSDRELDQILWHLDRYDRLRSSTASRASVTLSATAILSTGNAVILSPLFGSFRSTAPLPLLIAFTAIGVGSSVLVMMAMLRATNVLVTRRPSREWLPQRDRVPSGSPFNGHDVILEHRTFESFRTAAFNRPLEATIQAAQAELWICIQQHRHRYAQLRSAVRLLRLAALAFMAGLLVFVVANLIL